MADHWDYKEVPCTGCGKILRVKPSSKTNVCPNCRSKIYYKKNHLQIRDKETKKCPVCERQFKTVNGNKIVCNFCETLYPKEYLSKYRSE